MKFELEQSNRGATDDELLEDIRRCAKWQGTGSITVAQYDAVGRFSPTTIHKRLGSWTRALTLAGLELNRHVNISDEELFNNIHCMWVRLGRQPRYEELRRPESKYSAKPYETRFGSWSESLQQFVEWVNSDDPGVAFRQEAVEATGSADVPKQAMRRTRREPSERQRFRILVRDGFRCKSCGASPLVTPGVELHVDHILPWTQGGETTDENLETKCYRCNLGKGNAFNA